MCKQSMRTATHPTTSLQFLQSCLLELPHGMFNRYGGCSAPPYASLNVSYGVSDDPENVTLNRRLIKEALGITFLLSARQVHSDRIYCAPGITADLEVEECDALLTNQPGVGLLIQQADCQAILLHDPVNRAIAAVHCGWRGSACNIIGTTVAGMQRQFGTEPASLQAAISPSLGPCCSQFINYRQELPESLHSFQPAPDYFNFWAISTEQLRAAGVRRRNIEVAGRCTSCNTDYFSYRRSNSKGRPVTGRCGSVICLPVSP